MLEPITYSKTICSPKSHQIATSEKSISMRIVKYDDVVDYLDNLSTKMSKEVDLGHSYTPDLDHDQFRQIEDIGMLRVIIAESNGKTVGFHISTIQNDIFYKTNKTAYVLFYYFEKKYRGKGSGLKMFKFADDYFKENDVKRVFMSRKIHINNEKMFKKLGFNHIEANYEKYYV